MIETDFVTAIKLASEKGGSFWRYGKPEEKFIVGKSGKIYNPYGKYLVLQVQDLGCAWLYQEPDKSIFEKWTDDTPVDYPGLDLEDAVHYGREQGWTACLAHISERREIASDMCHLTLGERFIRLKKLEDLKR